MRLIDADELKNEILKEGNYQSNEKLEDYLIDFETLFRLIDNAPTIKTFTLLDIEEQYRKGLEKGLSEWETERPQGDLISRSEAEKLGATCLARRNENGQLEAIISLDNAPTVAVNCKDCDGYEAGYSAGLKDAERTQGEWIKIFENPFTNGYICPFCGHRIQVTEQFLPKMTECENCGADMKGGAE